MGAIIEEGRGHCIRHLLFKFTSEYDQRHYCQLPPTPPPPRPPLSKYMQSVCGWVGLGGGGGGGLLSRVEDRIRQEFHTLFKWPFSEHTKFLTHPKTKWKILEGRGPQTDTVTNCRKVLLQAKKSEIALPSTSLIFLWVPVPWTADKFYFTFLQDIWKC